MALRWIGLTGGIATGKSSVARVFVQHGIPVVDADVMARAVVEKGSRGLEQVAMEFGETVLNEDGTLNRAALAALVFGQKDRLAVLEGILHPLIRDRVEAEKKTLAARGVSLAIYDVPLLFEKAMEPLFESVIVVHCRPEQQVERLMKRMKITENEARTRIAQQLKLEDKIKKAQFVIDNSGTVDQLEAQVVQLIGKLTGT